MKDDYDIQSGRFHWCHQIVWQEWYFWVNKHQNNSKCTVPYAKWIHFCLAGYYQTVNHDYRPPPQEQLKKKYQSNVIKLFGFHPRVSFAPPSPVGPWRLWPRQGWSGSNGTSGPPASDPSEASVVGPLASCQLLANPCSLHLFFVGHLNSIPSQIELGTCFMSGVWQLPRWTWNAPKWQFKPLFLNAYKKGSGFKMNESHGLEDKEKGREVGLARLGISIARLMAFGEFRYNLKDKKSTPQREKPAW